MVGANSEWVPSCVKNWDFASTDLQIDESVAYPLNRRTFWAEQSLRTSSPTCSRDARSFACRLLAPSEVARDFAHYVSGLPQLWDRP